MRKRLAKEFRWAESSEQEREDKEEEEEADPLDAFMASIEVRVSLLCSTGPGALQLVTDLLSSQTEVESLKKAKKAPPPK